MFNQHPDILNDLFKIRAQEYQQKAVNYQLMRTNSENTRSLRKKMVQIGGQVLASFAVLLAWCSRQLSSVRIAEEIRRSS